MGAQATTTKFRPGGKPNTALKCELADCNTSDVQPLENSVTNAAEKDIGPSACVFQAKMKSIRESALCVTW